jgi:hypothetical protein
LTSPYREVEKEKPEEPKSGELVYRPAERVDRMAAGNSGFHLVAIPTAVAVVVGLFLPIEAAVFAFLAGIGGVVWWNRQRPKNVVVLRVAGGELSVFPMGVERDAFRVRLVDLEDVVLETKSVERVMDVGSNAVNIGTGALAPNIGPPTETKRIVLEPSGKSSHVLTKEFFGHTETTEWFAKVRVFLRNAGWTPLSERADEDHDETDDDDDDDDE